MSYSADYFTARESWRDWRIEAECLIELGRIAPGANVLEIGCGGGGLLRLLRAHGAYAVGIDTLDVALNLAKSRLEADRSALGLTRIKKFAKRPRSSALVRVPFVLRVGETEILPFANQSFDAIIGQHVVEHLPEIDAALNEWQRLLTPGGRLALATPNAYYPDPTHFADADHAHVFTPAELRAAFERAGFGIEHCSTIFPFLSHSRVLRASGVLAFRLFQRAPYFSSRGRTILLAAQKKS